MNSKIILWILGFLIAVFWVSSITGFFLLQQNFLKSHAQFSVQEFSDKADKNEEKIVVPVKAHIAIDRDGFYSSERDPKNIKSVFEQVNRIWEQAGVFFEVKEIAFTEIESKAVTEAVAGFPSTIAQVKGFDHKSINAFFVKHLSSINGIGFPQTNTVLIADFTTVNDFRVAAHELGHILGLKHLQENKSYLMFRGANGENLPQDDIKAARATAKKLLNSFFE